MICDGMLHVMIDWMLGVTCELMMTYLEPGRVVEELLMAKTPGRLHRAVLHCFNGLYCIALYFITLDFTLLYHIAWQ